MGSADKMTVGKANFKKQSGLKAKLAEYNKKYAIIIAGARLRVLDHSEDPPLFLTKQDFFDFKRADTIPIKKEDGTSKITEVSRLWFSDPGTTRYKKIAFEPGRETPADVYNSYRGFAVEPVLGSWALMKDHILQVICDGDQANFDYLIQLMARIVQDPGGEKPGVAVVMTGPEGTGKGLFMNYYGSIFGPHYLPVNEPRALVGRFTSALATQLVVFADEAMFVGNKAAGDKLKGLITEPTQIVEKKGLESFLTSNHVNVFMASNHDWVISASSSSRRYFVIETSDIHKGDVPYFSALAEEMQAGGPAAMMYDLLRVKVDADKLRTVPATRALQRQRAESLGSVAMFWLTCLTRGYIMDTEGFYGNAKEKTFEAGIKLDRNDLHQQYIIFCKDQGMKRIKTLPTFFRQTYGRGGVFPGLREKLTGRSSTERFFVALELGYMIELMENSLGININEEEETASRKESSGSFSLQSCNKVTGKGGTTCKDDRKVENANPQQLRVFGRSCH